MQGFTTKFDGMWEKRVVSLNFRDEVLAAAYHPIQALPGMTVS